LGSPTNTSAANLTIQGGTLRVIGSGGSTNRLFTIGTVGATIDSSGSSSINFNNTGAIVSADAPTNITGTTSTTAGSQNQITAVTDVSNLAVGMAISGTGIPAGTTILGIKPNFNTSSSLPTANTYTVFISQNATAAGAGVGLTFASQNRT